MLVKKSSKNQVALPKAILEEAGVGPEDVYFRITCQKGVIHLFPVEVEEKTPPEVVDRYRGNVLKNRKGNRSFRTMESLIADLKRAR